MKHLRLVFSWALLLFVTSVSQTAVAQVADGGVWKTSDGGSNWTPLTDTQVSLSVGSIALDPSNPNTIYVGTGEDNYAAGGSRGDENNLFHPEAPRAHKGAHPERPNEILA